MQQEEGESKEGLYDIYYTDSGKKLIVLEGLNPEDQFEPPWLQQQIHGHYDIVMAGYWLLLAATLLYLVFVHIVRPLWCRSKKEQR